MFFRRRKPDRLVTVGELVEFVDQLDNLACSISEGQLIKVLFLSIYSLSSSAIFLLCLGAQDLLNNLDAYKKRVAKVLCLPNPDIESLQTLLSEAEEFAIDLPETSLLQMVYKGRKLNSVLVIQSLGAQSVAMACRRK